MIGTLNMRSDLYQIETEKLATRNGELLGELERKLDQGADFSLLDEQALLHVLQVIIENAIGKGRHLLKRKNEKPPVSAYDVFERLRAIALIDNEEQSQWARIIGLRNTIVHEYMKIEIDLVKELLRQKQYKFVLEFLKKPFESFDG